MRSTLKGANCIWRHYWTKWEDKSEGVVKSAGRDIGKFVIQHRRCERCNELQMRTVEARISLWA